MTTDATRARRYLLRDGTDEESLAIERDYFESERTLEAIAAAEDDLIEDYLDDALTVDELVKFEREYLANAGHRRRVETIRQLRKKARPPHAAAERRTFADRSRRVRLRIAVLATAAILVLAVGAAVRYRTRSAATGATRSSVNAQRGGPSAPEPPIVAAPRVFAFAVPGGSLRSTTDAAALVIPAGIDIVSLELPSESGDQPTRATVSTAVGDEVWAGAVDRTKLGSPRIDVPASRLGPDDYIITVSGAGPQSSNRYVLHVRQR